jgi:hypothetical protein
METSPTTERAHMPLVNSSIDTDIASTNHRVEQLLSADIRLNMLTGLSTHIPVSHSLTASSSASTMTVERSKDALIRINELIRENSVQDVEKRVLSDDGKDHDNNKETSADYRARRRSIDISPIQYYIDETNKLTDDLERPFNMRRDGQTTEITNLDDDNQLIEQVK